MKIFFSDSVGSKDSVGSNDSVGSKPCTNSRFLAGCLWCSIDISWIVYLFKCQKMLQPECHCLSSTKYTVHSVHRAKFLWDEKGGQDVFKEKDSWDFSLYYSLWGEGVKRICSKGLLHNVHMHLLVLWHPPTRCAFLKRTVERDAGVFSWGRSVLGTSGIQIHQKAWSNNY